MPMRYYAPFPGGEPVVPRGPHALRIGDAERDAAAADLGEHYVAGRLTLGELDERLGQVLAARTRGQLTRIMADLPHPRRLWAAAGPVSWAELSPYPGWDPVSFRHQELLAAHGHGRGGPGPAAASSRRRDAPTAADRAGRLAALSLLLIAMLIWLFTALLFARHGLGQPPGPGGHFGPGGFGPGGFGPGGFGPDGG